MNLTCFFQIDLNKSFEFGLGMDAFRTNRYESIHPGITMELTASVEVIDSANRSLILLLTFKPSRGALKLYVSAPFWLVNKSGLPLVVRQSGANQLAAGQFEEHEKARAMLPLMFSFPGDYQTAHCELRLGKDAYGRFLPLWSEKFVLEPGITFRQLRLMDPSSTQQTCELDFVLSSVARGGGF